jgi:Lrp/AsnC family transcriptional regulator, leucine-responsive regulatory protein
VSLDRFDKAILTALEGDGRMRFAALGDSVGLSKTPCWRRVQALEGEGVITGYRAVIDPQKVGLGLSAFVTVKIARDRHDAFEKAVDALPSILACYTTAGDGDYLLHIMTSSVEALDQLLRHDLNGLPGVEGTSTTVCLKQTKQHPGLARLI